MRPRITSRPIVAHCRITRKMYRAHALLVVVVAAAVSGCAALGPYSPTAGLEAYSIFQPAKFPAGEWSPTAVLVQDAHFNAADGTKLHGWYISHDKPRDRKS